MKTLSLKLPDELDAKLTRTAQQHFTTKSELIRQALRAYLNDIQQIQPASVLDLAGDLIGSLEGPADLSHNKNHLQGYGE